MLLTSLAPRSILSGIYTSARKYVSQGYELRFRGLARNAEQTRIQTGGAVVDSQGVCGMLSGTGAGLRDMVPMVISFLRRVADRPYLERFNRVRDAVSF